MWSPQWQGGEEGGQASAGRGGGGQHQCSEGVNTSVCKGHGTMACGVHSDREERRGAKHLGGVNISAVKGVKYVCEGRSGRVKHLVWGKGRAVRVRI